MIFIGVDESGLGAWAGPATACAVAIDSVDAEVLHTAGVRDSKTLSDTRRRGLISAIVENTISIAAVLIPIAELDTDFREAWRKGMATAAIRAAGRIQAPEIVFDGSPDRLLGLRIANALPSAYVRFVPKADQKYPAVGAASIIAKTLRNDRMLRWASMYPEYAWDRNSGYHAKEHLAAILKYGITPAHRRIRPIRQLLETKQAKERK